MKTIPLKVPRRLREEQHKPMIVPAETIFDQLNLATATYERVRDDYAAAFDLIELKRRAVADAQSETVHERAEARLAGKTKKPSEAKAQAAQAELKEAERDEEALALAMRKAVHQIEALLDENREQWKSEARATIEAKRERFAELAKELAPARDEWLLASALLAWLESGGAFNPAVHAPPWPTSLEELEIECGLREPAPKTLREHVARKRREGPVVIDGALVVTPSGDAA